MCSADGETAIENKDGVESVCVMTGRKKWSIVLPLSPYGPGVTAFWGSTGLNGWGGTTGNLLADFLLKDMGWGFSEASVASRAESRWKDLEFYVNDTWKVRPNVTLDLGVRYSIFFNPSPAGVQPPIEGSTIAVACITGRPP